jgi:signal transduction histidine kinase
VENLRPPALDDLGLTGALRQLTEPYAPAVSLTAPEELPPMAAAAEVAAYRIAAEAVTNAIRHARCDQCTLTVRADDGWLVVEVTDNGIGLAPDVEPGVGLHSIRDRTSEVGGRLEVREADGGGTTVRARLPLAAPQQALAPGRLPAAERRPVLEGTS